MKPVKPIHTDDISSMKIDTMGKLIDQVTERDVRDVQKNVFLIFSEWRYNHAKKHSKH